MLHNAIVGLFADHRREFAISRIDIVVKVFNNRGKLLFRLLVKVGDCYTSSEDGIVGVGDGHICSSLRGL